MNIDLAIVILSSRAFRRVIINVPSNLCRYVQAHNFSIGALNTEIFMMKLVIDCAQH